MAGPPPHSVPDAFPAARYGDDGDGDPVAAPVPPPDPVLSSLGPGRMGTPPPPTSTPQHRGGWTLHGSWLHPPAARSYRHHLICPLITVSGVMRGSPKPGCLSATFTHVTTVAVATRHQAWPPQCVCVWGGGMTTGLDGGERELEPGWDIPTRHPRICPISTRGPTAGGDRDRIPPSPTSCWGADW